MNIWSFDSSSSLLVFLNQTLFSPFFREKDLTHRDILCSSNSISWVPTLVVYVLESAFKNGFLWTFPCFRQFLVFQQWILLLDKLWKVVASDHYKQFEILDYLEKHKSFSGHISAVKHQVTYNQWQNVMGISKNVFKNPSLSLYNVVNPYFRLT